MDSSMMLAIVGCERDRGNMKTKHTQNSMMTPPSIVEFLIAGEVEETHETEHKLAR
jgi:hypothetical protein